MMFGFGGARDGKRQIWKDKLMPVCKVPWNHDEDPGCYWMIGVESSNVLTMQNKWTQIPSGFSSFLLDFELYAIGISKAFQVGVTVFGLAVKALFGTLEHLGLVLAPLPVPVPANVHLVRKHVMAYLGPCHPHGQLWLIYGLLTLVWPSPHYYRHSM